MELRQLELFVGVAEEGHFGRAAERLYIGRAALSRQVRRLELQVGAVLFDRSDRGVHLTAAGHALLVEVRNILTRVDAVVPAPARRVAARPHISEMPGRSAAGPHDQEEDPR